jgi:hypothetical protein
VRSSFFLHLLFLPSFLRLRSLSCSNNSLKYFGDLSALRELQFLEKISLIGNIVSSMPFYREFVLSLTPGLVSLDGVPITLKDKLEAKQAATRARLFYDQIRLNHLRNNLLLHVQRSVLCHTQLLSTFQTHNRRQSVGLSQRSGPSGVWPVPLTTARAICVLKQALNGGCFRWLFAACAADYDRAGQVT